MFTSCLLLLTAKLDSSYTFLHVIFLGAGHSTMMAVQDMVERVSGAWNSKRAALGVFIDLKKAFNTVDHGILLAKLEDYGVRGEVLRLLGSYLEGRFQ
jgi:hypothetical protein